MPLHIPLIYGNLLLGVSTFFVAPMTHRGTLFSSVFALYVTGICDPLIYVAGLPVAYDALKDRYVGQEQPLKDYITVSVYFAIASGNFLGPILGSFMTSAFGFR